MNKKVILVDNHEQVIGVEDKLKAHQRGLLHRAFSVFIFREYNGQIELLLQQRQQDKYHSPNLWSNTCCSHPEPNEDIFSAAKRRLLEEMGIQTTLSAAGSFTYQTKFDNGLIEHEFDHVLTGNYSNDPIRINEKEVASYQWLPLPVIKDKISKNPEKFTPWFKEALEIAVLSRI